MRSHGAAGVQEPRAALLFGSLRCACVLERAAGRHREVPVPGERSCEWGPAAGCWQGRPPCGGAPRRQRPGMLEPWTGRVLLQCTFTLLAVHPTRSRRTRAVGPPGRSTDVVTRRAPCLPRRPKPYPGLLLAVTSSVSSSTLPLAAFKSSGRPASAQVGGGARSGAERASTECCRPPQARADH